MLRVAWPEWLKYFLRGIHEQAREALSIAQQLRDLRNTWREEVSKTRGTSANVLRAIDALFGTPILTVPQLSQILEIDPPSARYNMKKLVQAGIVCRYPTRSTARGLRRFVKENEKLGAVFSVRYSMRKQSMICVAAYRYQAQDHRGAQGRPRAGGCHRSVRATVGAEGALRRPLILGTRVISSHLPLLRPTAQVVGRHGVGDVVALSMIATQLSQAVECRWSLDTLGGNCESEVVGKADDGADDGAKLTPRIHPAHEGPVDLHIADR